MESRKVLGLVLLFCWALGACGFDFGPPTGEALERMELEERREKYRDLLKRASACLARRCEAHGGLKARNDLESLKCHTLSLALREGRVCLEKQKHAAPLLAAGSEKSNRCAPDVREMSLLYDSLYILRC